MSACSRFSITFSEELSRTLRILPVTGLQAPLGRSSGMRWTFLGLHCCISLSLSLLLAKTSCTDWLPAAGLHCFFVFGLHVHHYLCGALTGLHRYTIRTQFFCRMLL